MNKLETLKDIIADKYDGCYEVTRECVKAYANVDTALLDLKDLDLVLMIPIGTWAVQNEKRKNLSTLRTLMSRQRKESLR